MVKFLVLCQVKETLSHDEGFLSFSEKKLSDSILNQKGFFIAIKAISCLDERDQ